MTTEEIDKSIKSRRLCLTKWALLEHWLNLIFFLLFFYFIGYPSMEQGYDSIEFIVFSIFACISLALLVRHKVISTKLDSYDLVLTKDQFEKANEDASRLNNWSIISNDSGYFEAIRNSGWHWEGIKITAILSNERVFLNSMITPSIRSHPFSIGINAKNKSALIQQYESVLNGKDVLSQASLKLEEKEKEFWKESEWNFKNGIKRIILYLLSVVFFALGIAMIVSGQIKILIPGIFLTAASCTYIISDIVILAKKNKHDHNKV